MWMLLKHRAAARKPDPSADEHGWRLPGVAEPAQVIANGGRRPGAEGAKASRFPSEILAAQGGAGEPYEDLGAGSLQMKPSASTLTFCSQSRPSAGSVQAYHVFLPREGGAGRLNDTHPVLRALRWRGAPLIALYSDYLAAIHIERIRRVSPLHACEALTVLLGYARPPPPESQRTSSSQDLCGDADGGGRPSP